MNDILVDFGEVRIECEVNGDEFIYKYSDDKYYVSHTLKDETSYAKLKAEIRDVYNSCDDKDEAFALINDTLQYADFCDKYFVGIGHMWCDLRTRDEIIKYENEAFDKVWLMRTRPTDIPKIEEGRVKAIERILDTYDDIPVNGYSDWECGYWNGILGALRWVMGEERDFLDT